MSLSVIRLKSALNDALAQVQPLDQRPRRRRPARGGERPQVDLERPRAVKSFRRRSVHFISIQCMMFISGSPYNIY